MFAVAMLAGNQHLDFGTSKSIVLITGLLSSAIKLESLGKCMHVESSSSPYYFLISMEANQGSVVTN